jgi:WD40 repeat protein
MQNSLRLLTTVSLLSGFYLTSCNSLPTTATDTSATNPPVSTTTISQDSPALEDWKNAELLYTFWGHSKPINQVIFSPNGNFLASSDGLEIVIWETQTGESQAILPGHISTTQGGIYPAPIPSLAFSSDGTMLASSSWSQGIAADDSLIVWDVQTGEKIHRLVGSDGCNEVIFSQDGQKLISSCGLGVQVWDARTGKQLLQVYEDRPVDSITLSPDGTVLATVDLNVSGGFAGEDSRVIRLWRLTDTEATPLDSLTGHTGEVDQIAFSPDGAYLVSSSYDNTVKVWDWQNGEVAQTLSEYRQDYENDASFSLSPKGTLIAGNFSDGIIRNWKTGEKVDHGILVRMQGSTHALAFSPDGQMLAWTGKPPTFSYPILRLWRISETGVEDPYKGEDVYRRDRANYDPIPLNSDTNLTGNNPQEVVLNRWGLSELRESQQQDVQVNYPSKNKAVVTLTQTGLLDDSVEGIRYRAEFIAMGNSWEMIWAGKQYKCNPNRGHTDWSTELCL